VSSDLLPTLLESIVNVAVVEKVLRTFGSKSIHASLCEGWAVGQGYLLWFCRGFSMVCCRAKQQSFRTLCGKNGVGAHDTMSNYDSGGKRIGMKDVQFRVRHY
jgi:hypothetical protein